MPFKYPSTDPKTPESLYPSGMWYVIGDPPLPPNVGEWVPASVTKVTESSQSPFRIIKSVICSPAGTLQDIADPPFPPNDGLCSEVVPSLV